MVAWLVAALNAGRSAEAHLTFEADEAAWPGHNGGHRACRGHPSG